MNDMSNISPEMIEAYMKDKVDHINAVYEATEKKCADAFEKKKERNELASQKMMAQRAIIKETRNDEGVKQEIEDVKKEIGELKEMLRAVIENKAQN